MRGAGRWRTWTLWVVGAALIVALASATADPALLPLLLAPESVALLVESALLYTVVAVRDAWLPRIRALYRRGWRTVALAHLRIETAVG